MLMTTTPEVEGRHIVEYMDVITAQGVLGVNAFTDVAAGMRNIFGGRSKSYENELTAGVNSVLDELRKHATEMGADARRGRGHRLRDRRLQHADDQRLGHRGQAELKISSRS